MNIKIFVSALLVFTASAYIFITGENSINSTYNTTANIPPLPPAGNISDSYIIGAMDCARDRTYDNLYDLGLNLWHKYLKIYRLNDSNTEGWDWWKTSVRVDNLYNIKINYDTVVTNWLTANQNKSMRTLMERPKIEQLCFGQRSDYQCESTNLNPDLWFYAFNEHDVGASRADDVYDTDPQYGNNHWVRHLMPDPVNPPAGQNYVVRRLRANSEQCNSINPLGQVQGDIVYDWHIKPSIRADKNYVENPVNYENPICRIDIFNYDNTLIKSTIIRVRNFKNDTNYYDGRYKEEFRFTGTDSTLKFLQWQAINFNPDTKNWAFSSRGTGADGTNKMDIKVYWYGTCEMWIDYVRVDNDVADKLFKGYYEETNTNHDWLHWEAELANHNSSPLKFYIEEFEFNNIPCMSYVSRKLKEYTGNNLSLMSVVNPPQLLLHLPESYVDDKNISSEFIIRYLIDSVGETQVFSEPYSLTGNIDGSLFNDSYVPNSLPVHQRNISEGRLGVSVSPSIYEPWLQEHLDCSTFNKHTKKGYFTWYLKMMDTLSKANNIPHINMPQAHLWFMRNENQIIEDALREPTNEEMKMLTFMPITYGARGTIYFEYASWGIVGSNSYGVGLTNWDGPGEDDLTPRITNVYGQSKWDTIRAINQKLSAWSQYIMSFNNMNRSSYIYYKENERNDLKSQTWFEEIYTFATNPSNPNEPIEQPDNINNRYLQIGTFKTDIFNDQFANYFMIVNRRCSPINTDLQDYGGKRNIKIKFHPSHMNFFTNWKIIDLETGDLVATVNKNSTSVYNFGWFLPGDAKLYKMVPVMVDGGTLAYDETCGNFSGQLTFNCKAPVYNNGHNCDILNGTTIEFNEIALIEMTGGEFTCGINGGAGSTTLKGINNGTWQGLSLLNCPTANFDNTTFNDVNETESIRSDINAYNCNWINVSNCTFNIPQSQFSSGAVTSSYNNMPSSPVINITNCTFNDDNPYPDIYIGAYAQTTADIFIDHNIFTSSNTSDAVILSNISGGKIKNNTFSNYQRAVNILSSGVDFYHNTINNNSFASKSIAGEAGSIINLSPFPFYATAGRNTFNNTYQVSKNIEVDNSIILLDNGANNFNITEASNSLHLSGTFSGEPISIYPATQNCWIFNNGGGVPVSDLSWYQIPQQVNFNFWTECENWGLMAGSLIIDQGYGVYDSIQAINQPGGGSLSGRVIITPKQIYDSLKLNMRLKNYGYVTDRSQYLINNYPDSLFTLDCISKLYTSKYNIDTSIASKQELKTFYETLILNNPDNTALVKRANYYVQKCKVLLKQYQSAMAGFDLIVQQNPYTYEALVAHWDYMATHLLDSLSGGSVMGDGDDDKSPFTKEQKVLIKTAVKDALNTDKEKSDKKLKLLEKETREGNTVSEKELKHLKALEEVVKTKHPKNIFEHIKIVNEDIQKVFSVKGNSNKILSSQLPDRFAISQNYPNPFNPVTRINYQLPRDAMMTIIVYDILGREVYKIMNNEFKKAGYYTAYFSALNYASGVYFYQVIAKSGNGDIEFTESKKMVLVK